MEMPSLRCCLLLMVASVVSIASGGSEHVRELEVSEGAAIGTRIGNIAVSGSSGPPYLIVPVSGSVEGDLSIDRGGEVRTKVLLDRETRASYAFVAIPLSGGGGGGEENNPGNNGTGKVFVHVRVLDENDNAPTFPTPMLHVSFPENTPRDVKRTLPPAKDLDLDVFSTQRYNIIAGNERNVFRLSSHRERDGVLYLDVQISGQLDRETVAAYKLVIEALDGGVPPLRGEMTVNVSVEDVNDNQPLFNQSRYFGSVPENATVGTRVLQVSATDADAGDNGRVEYFINRRQSDRDTMFLCDPATGVISVARPLDFETKHLHELVLVARDRGAQPLETTAFVSINVLDVNDNRPTIDVIFLSDDASPKIAEDARAGEFVARISVHDADSRAEYENANVTLSGGDGRFGLATRDNIVYLVIVAQPLDREAQPVHVLNVAATDAGTPPLSATRTIRLRVTDVNDNAPEFERDVYAADVLEATDPGASVVRVVAHDRDDGDNAKVTYTLIDTPDTHSEWFRVDARTGLVTTRTHIDCETNPRPRLTIAATDSGRPPLSTTTRVHVNVHDVNDNEPIFDQSFYNASVSESEVVGKCVLKVSASDPDCGVNALVNYTLDQHGHHGGKMKEFEVRASTGDVCILSPLDFEARSVFEFAVLATDRGGLSTTAMVSIRVTDANDNAPVFYPRTYNVSLTEPSASATTSTSSINTPVVIVAATDRDSGRYGTLSYRITAGNEAGLFRIDRVTGELFVTRPSSLSARGQRYHRLNVSATDGGGLRAHHDAQVLIAVVDSTQRPPIFQQARYTFSVGEDVRRGSIVGTVQAAIAAAGDDVHRSTSTAATAAMIRYAICSGDPDGLFTIDPITGSIRTSVPLDREVRANVLLNIQATSGGGAPPPAYGHTQVEIIVEDVNDNAPEFESTTVRISVPENVATNATLFVAHAIDRDAGANCVVTYRLTGGAHHFHVHATTGHVTLLRALDYETAQRHSVHVIATDSGRPPAAANLTLLVDVQDVNDNAPVFERVDYTVDVLETMPINAQILQVTAVDADSGNNARLTYRFITDASDAFGIFPNSGVLYLKRQLDREERAHFALPLVAVDNGTPAMSTTTHVTVRVLDANDNDPVFERDAYTFAVEENCARGAFVGVVKAHDVDEGVNAAIHYTLLATNSSSFHIHAQSGVITTKAPLDREHSDVHEVTVEASDQGTPSRHTRIHVQVRVLDVNDNAPDIVDPLEDVVSVREEQPPGTEVVHVRAVDADHGQNATISYDLPDGSGVFTIDTRTGVIRTVVVLEHSQQPIHRLTVTASDYGSPPKRSHRTLRVHVLDINDNRPTFTSSSLVFRVREDVSIGFVVGSIAPTYAASGGGDSTQTEIAYKLSSDAHPNVFDIDRSSGSLIVTDLLDRERHAEYKLEVRALDASTLQSSAVTVRVDIADANDNAPHWSQDPITIILDEDMAIGCIAHNLSATDADAGSNGQVRYSLLSHHHPPPPFTMDPITGDLVLTQTLDYETQQEYTLIVHATDQSLNVSERLTSAVTVLVRIRDVNDNAPKFVRPRSAAIQFSSATSVGAAIAHILATDLDAGANALINYVITAGNENGYFTLGYDTGVLALAKSIHLIDDVAMVHRLNISANDRGRPSLSAHQQFALTVSDDDVMDAQQPARARFAQNSYHAEVAENLQPGAFVVKLSSAHIRTQHADEGTFLIPHGAANDSFAIDPVSGNVTTLKALDREVMNAYVVPIYLSSQLAAKLAVSVTDANDNAPTFHSGACYALSIPENSETSVVHVMVAHDLDTGHNGLISYAIVAGNTGNKFSINAATGEVSARSLDRETQARYHLHIVAQDKGVPQLQGACNLTVFVQDLNDNDPIFDSHLYTATINEDVPPDTSVLKVVAHDADAGLNAKIVYSVANESQMFRIDNRTGVLWTAGQFDRETQEVYNFLVLATDCGKSKTRSRQVHVRVMIADINDNRPQFAEYPFQEKITAYLQPGQAIAKVFASDTDVGLNAEIIYSLAPHSDAKFSIHPNTGIVSARQSLAHENGKIVRLNVIASDKGNPSLSDYGLIELFIGDQVSSSRGQQPTLTFPNSTYNVTIAENADAATYLTQVFAVRSDGRKQRMSYSLAHASSSSAFAIDAETGVIRIRNASMLNFEMHKQMQFAVSASSESAPPLYAHCRVVVHLTDQNDNAPKFTQQEYMVAVQEGMAKGTFVVRTEAVDVDEGRNAMLRYHIVDGNHDNAFRIEPAFSGTIKTSIVLDREIRDTYRLTVIAIDEGVPQMTGTARIRINVLDVNDNLPSFPPNSVINVAEDTPLGSVLTTITANDVDTSPTLVYNFTDDVDIGVRRTFAIDKYSGKVVLRQPLDYEAVQEYKLKVVASDGIHQAQTIRTLHVTDVNDNRPQFLHNSYQATILFDHSNRLLLQTVLTVNATDADSGENSQLKYSIPSPSPIPGFQIDLLDGVVRVNASLLAKHEGVHYLTVQAEDEGKPPLSATTVIRISIPRATGNNFDALGIDNNNSQREIRRSVLENATAGVSIISLPPFADASDLTYDIRTGNDDHKFEVIDGNVVVIGALDRETKDTYDLQIACNHANLNVRIDVEDVNDNRPQFTHETHQIRVNESVPLGYELMTINAIDADSANSPNSRITYDITSGNDLHLFAISPSSGVLKVAGVLDFDCQHTTHTLIVRACDMGTQPLCAISQVRVLLEDVNDNSPQFPVAEYLEFIAENAAIGSSVFVARAFDSDAGPFGNVTYSIASISSQSDETTKLFNVDKVSGLVTSNAVFDYEIRNRYVFLIRTTDIGGRWAEVKVRVEIESRDEFYPHFMEKTYKFTLPTDVSGVLPSGLTVGQVTATDRDCGPDGRLVYQLSSQNAHFKMNRTTGAILIKKKLALTSIGREISLVVTASSGRPNSLTNLTVVELSMDRNNELGQNLAINNQTIAADGGGISDWALGLLIAILLLLITFGALFVFLHMKNKRNKKVNCPNLRGQEQMNVTTNNYVDPTAFDTIPIRGGTNSQFAPPKYDEIPPYAAAASSNSGAATTSELSGSEQSGSSGRGSAEDVDDNEDEEIRMINEGPMKQQRQKDDDNLSDMSVRNTQEYLARLGIVNNVSSNAAVPQTSRIAQQLPLESLMFVEDANCDDIANFYAKLNDVASSSDRASNADDTVGTVVSMDHMMSGYGQIPNHKPSMNGSLSSIVHSEEELAGSYNWDYLLDWGPQYQPLAHVFSEIARLKDDNMSVQSDASGSSAKSKTSQPKTMPPPLITSIAPRLTRRGGSNHRLNHISAVIPRSPINHEHSAQYNGSAVMSPSFSPSLSPLATKSPSMSPLVAPGLSAAHHVRQVPARAKNSSIDSSEMRI